MGRLLEEGKAFAQGAHSTIPDVSTGHSYRTSQSTIRNVSTAHRIAPCEMSVPDTARHARREIANHTHLLAPEPGSSIP
eukprot:822535-Rhodomonas_salina.2